MKVKEMIGHQNSDEEMAKVLRMSPWNVKKLEGQARKFSELSLREGILNCQKTDLALKGHSPKSSDER